jgi:adenine-specific DNA-methyltransferase
MLALARESSEKAYVVEPVHGPWSTAIDIIKTQAPGDVTVYLDAPYKRDEYSRYYHVLELLVKYNYPVVAASTRIPGKASGDRFDSEFSTRSRSAMSTSLGKVISAVLAQGWRCAWSYSSDGIVSNVGGVLEGLDPQPSRVVSVGAEHAYKRQGRHSRARHVQEFLIMLEP